MKKHYFTYIMAVAIILAAFLIGFLLHPADTKTSGREMVMKTEGASYGLQVFKNKILIHKTGETGEKDWKPEVGLHIVDALVARRQEGAEEELLVIIGPKGSKYGNRFEILGVDINGTLQRRAFESMEDMNPWELQTADVDGDGIQDISITMYKKTKFHPVMANRPFLYIWKEDRIEPLWRGSRLSRPFDDYVFSDLNGDGRDELIATEHLKSGDRVLQAYYWKGFGFEGLAQSISLDKISSLQIDPKTGDVQIQAETMHYTAVYKDGTLQLFKEE